MIITFLSKIMANVLCFLVYEILTAIPTLDVRKMHTLNVCLRSFYQKISIMKWMIRHYNHEKINF